MDGSIPANSVLYGPPLFRHGPRVLIHLLKSKLHRATVTGGDLNYEGSLTISADLCEKIQLLEYERILVGNMANGNRFETYVIYGEAGRAEIILNGAVSWLGKKGDRLTIMNFGSYTPEEAAKHVPKVLVLDELNSIVKAD